MRATRSIGPGVGPGSVQPSAAFTISGLAGKLLWVDARLIAGNNGDQLNPIADNSGLAQDFSQATGANRPTLNTSWQGGKAIATSGTQWATRNTAIVTGLSAYSWCWVGQFATVATARTAFCLGNNANNGFDWNAHRGGANRFGMVANAIAVMDSDLTANTSAHFVCATFDNARSPKWILEIDGVARTLTNNVAPANAQTQAIFGAVNTSGTFGMSGNTGLLLVASQVWDAATRANLRANAKASWTLP